MKKNILIIISLLYFLGVFVEAANFIDSEVLIELTNTEREKIGLESLNINPLLIKAAQAKVDDMMSEGYFSHNSPEGKTAWDWMAEVKYRFLYAGENIAMNSSNSESIINMWMLSPLHKKNILNKNFTEIGIAVSEGVYQGEEIFFIVQLFGKPIDSDYQTVIATVQDTEQHVVVILEKEGFDSKKSKINSEKLESSNKEELKSNLDSGKKESKVENDFFIDDKTKTSKNIKDQNKVLDKKNKLIEEINKTSFTDVLWNPFVLFIDRIINAISNFLV